jgi:hypothetical protein
MVKPGKLLSDRPFFLLGFGDLGRLNKSLPGFTVFVDDIHRMAFAAGSGLARPKDRGNSRENEGFSLKPGVSSGSRNICSSWAQSEVPVGDVAVTFFILNFLL